MAQIPSSFFDVFTRPQQHVKTAIYSDQLNATASSAAGKKYQTLFSDAFGHHVQFYLDTPPELVLLPDDSRRFVSADSLTSVFLNVLYEPPRIFETPNTEYSADTQISFANFLKSISDT